MLCYMNTISDENKKENIDWDAKTVTRGNMSAFEIHVMWIEIFPVFFTLIINVRCVVSLQCPTSRYICTRGFDYQVYCPLLTNYATSVIYYLNTPWLKFRAAIHGDTKEPISFHWNHEMV